MVTDATVKPESVPGSTHVLRDWCYHFVRFTSGDVISQFMGFFTIGWSAELGRGAIVSASHEFDDSPLTIDATPASARLEHPTTVASL